MPAALLHYHGGNGLLTPNKTFLLEASLDMVFYPNNIKTTNTQDLICPKLSSNSLCQQVLWEFGLTTNCVGMLGPTGMVSSGATGLDKIWEQGLPSLSLVCGGLTKVVAW